MKDVTLSGRLGIGAALALLFLLAALPALAGSSSTTLPNGAQLTVSITSPADGTQFLADGAPVTVPVTGTASVGVGPPQATFVYVFDASGSTASSGGACGSVLQCEQTFFTGLNTAGAASGSVNHIGLVVFGNDAVKADMSPGAGDAQLGAPADGNTVITSIALTSGDTVYDVAQYTPKSGNASATNYAAALQLALAELTASTDAKKFLFFASDGLSNAGTLANFNTALTAIAATGTVANSFAVGASSACTGGTQGNLAQITVNGGTCYEVPDPNHLPDLIPNLIGSTLTNLTMSVDGGPSTPVATTPSLPQPGPVTVSYSTVTAGLNPGSHDICVTAFATDVTGGSGNTSTCVKVYVYDLVLTPPTATNELGGDNTHTVTATLLGPPGLVGGYLVSFAVGGQNAGALGTCSPADCKTDASGNVTFTYSVPPSSVGTDTISASVTLGNPTGATDTEVVTKTWVDQPITATGTTISATEGAGFSGAVANFTDPDPSATASEYAATINWGDGSPLGTGTVSGSGPFTVSGTHTYTEEGTYAITVTITDVDTPSNSATATSTANVGDASITATCPAHLVSPMSFSGAVANLSDANPFGTAADFTATINWGDGSPLGTGLVSGSGPFTVSGGHAYASTGFFTITTSIADDGGSTAKTSCTVLVFATSAGGSFVIGDGNSAVGTHVTFWGAQWWKLNTLSGGPAPASFKGFEDTPSSAPACGVSWSTDPGNSTPPPAGPLPGYMAVIVSSSISKSGSTISGNTPHVVVVQTDPGYAPNPGHAGTGTVVGVVC